MRGWRVAIVLGLGLAGSCVPALHPFYTAENLVFEPALLGTWHGPDGGTRWTFSRAGEHGYDVELARVAGEARRFEVHLFRLGGHLFLDSFPRLAEGDVRGTTILPVHTVSRVWLEGDVLRVGMLSPDWIAEMIEGRRLLIDHVRTESGLVLTAPTDELQRLILVHAQDERAFRKPGRCDSAPGRRIACIEPRPA